MIENVNLGCYFIGKDVDLPQYGTAASACFDIKSNFHMEKIKSFDSYNKQQQLEVFDFKTSDSFVLIPPLYRALIPTGVIFEIPIGYSLRLHPRSGNSFKKGFTLANCQGVVDFDYYHETFVLITNLSDDMITIKNGDKIAQAELVKDVPVNIIKSVKKPTQSTDRAGGFGSTGE